MSRDRFAPPGPTRVRRVLGVWVFTVLAATTVLAQSVAPADNWRWSRFTTRDGLPSDEVVDVVDAYDGTLWVLARGGVAYFDGFRWQAVPLPATVAGQAGTIAAISGGGIAVLSGAQLVIGDRYGFVLANANSGKAATPWRTMAVARGSRVLLLGDEGVLFEWDGHAIHPHEASSALGRVHKLYRAGHTGVWISTDRGLYSYDSGSWRRRMAPAAEYYDVSSAVELPNGRAWAYISYPPAVRGLWRWEGNAATLMEGTRQSTLSQAVSLAIGRGGEVLAAHQTGQLTVFRDRTWSPLTTHDVEINDAHRIGLRANGDLWVASDHGLFVHSPSAARWSFLTFPSADGRNGINDIYRGVDELWLATANGLVRVQRGTDQVEHIEKADGEFLGGVTGVVRDARDRLWISSGGSFTGVRWRDRAGWHRLTGDAQLERSYVHRVVVDTRGGVWFLGIGIAVPPGEREAAGGPGAFRLSPDGRIERWGTAEGLKSGRVYAVAEGPDGALWFGTGGGLSRWLKGQWRHWNEADGLAIARVYTVAVGPGGSVWFGHQTGGGLGRLVADKPQYFTAADGLASNLVNEVRVDAKGRVWASGLGGLSLFEDGNWTIFDMRSGLRSSRVWPVLAVTDQVYVGTTGGGLAILNLLAPSAPPIVVAESPIISADAVRIMWQAFAWWGEMASADVPTRVRFDDGAWTSWSTERTQRFGSVAPGDHTLRIQAKGLLGHPGPVTTVAVAIARPFYLRPVYFVPIGALLVTSIGLLVHAGVRDRRHRRELKERERRFSQVFDNSPLACVIATIDERRILEVNEAFCRISGYRSEEVVGRTPVELGMWPRPEDRSVALPVLNGLDVHQSVETTMRRKSGEVAHVMMHAARIEIGGKTAIVSQTTDITTQRRLEGQLRQAHKMESIGRLAGGIAHDFNNFLTVIIGNASLLDDHVKHDELLHDHVHQIRFAAERAEKLTRQLLAFSRKQVVEPRSVNLNDVVLKTDRMLRRLIGDHVELVAILAPDVSAVLVDPSQIEQVLVNMAVNGRDAMPHGGTLTIRTAEVELTADDPVREPDTPPGAYVRLSIADTGTGIDEDTAAHMFDPFFTTKDAGKGTGLGLATCYGIVKQALGQITIVSEIGIGTVFNIDLPVSDVGHVPSVTSDPPAEVPTGREFVLLVEDEVQVRKLAASALRQRGFEVHEAASGEDALQFESTRQGPIDILVTDVVMPQMRGTELAARLRERRPALKVLFMSGYADDDMFHQDMGRGPFAFLAKPFTLAALAAKVRERLDAPAE
ncbi:MAG: response regulator [Acidobacteriota bacterium]